MWKRMSWVLLLGLASGCGLSDSPPQESVVATASSGCPTYYGCSSNASSKSFEIDVGPQHKPNGAGFVVTAIRAPDVPPYNRRAMKLEFASTDLDTLIGSIPSLTWGTPPTKLYNNQLIGMTLTLSRPGLVWGQEEEYELRLVGIDWFDSMVGSPPDRVTSYYFRFRQPTWEKGASEPLCPTEPNAVTANGAYHHAVVFQGDRYDSQGKVTETTEPWINIACAGTAMAKLHLLRHTKAGTGGLFSTSLSERQAMLRMLRADYCGDGTSYTLDGTPIRYADSNGWHTHGLDLTQTWQRARVEALWNADGAMCLDLPRRATYDQISCLSALPHCSPSLVGWETQAHVASAKPGWGLTEPLNLQLYEQPLAVPDP